MHAHARRWIVAVVLPAAGLGFYQVTAARQTPSRLTVATSADPTPKPPPALVKALTALHEEARPTQDGGVEIINGVYHARFNADGGVTYVPKVDRAYDTTLTWQYRFESLTTGATTTSAAPVAPVATENIVEYRRGTLVERYIGRREGVEQVFELTAPVEGDVRLRGRVDLAQGVTVESADGGLTFTYPGGRQVTYRKPVAHDRDKRPVAVTATIEGDKLDLTIADEDLQGRQFPVTIDPLISAAVITFSADSTFGTDVAYNWARSEFLVVFSADTTDPDRQIRVKRFDAAGNSFAGSTLVYTGPGATRPKVAYHMASDQYLVVWQDTTIVFILVIGDIKGQVLNSTSGLVGGTIDISNAAGAIGFFPDVAARDLVPVTFTAGQTAWMVTWTGSDDNVTPSGEFHTKRQRINSAGAEIGLNDANLSANTTPFVNALSSNTAVTFDPHNDRFFVAWVRDTQIKGISLTPMGGTGAEFFVSDAGGAEMAQQVDVAYDLGSRRYIAVWVDDRDGAVDDEIWGDIMTDLNFTSELGDFEIDSNLGGFPTTNPFVVSEIGGFIVGYERANTDKDIYHSFVTPDATVTLLGFLESDSGTPPNHNDEIPSMAIGQYGFGFLAFTKDEDGGAFDGGVYVAPTYGRFTHFVHGRTGDYGSSAASDLFIFRPASGAWFIRETGSAVTSSLGFGAPGDIPVLMDIDGDSLADLGVFRPQTGAWFVRRRADGIVVSFGWGAPGDIPVPGDYNGDGLDDAAVFRPSNAAWYVRSTATGLQIAGFGFGGPGDVPVAADYDGDGDVDPAVWRPSNGAWYKINLDGSGSTAVGFGAPGDIPLQGNFTGTSLADQVVFRPATGAWFIRDGQTGTSSAVGWGGSGDVPMPLDYDNDGLLDQVVWRPGTGAWYIREADSGVTTAVGWGGPGDIPAGAR